MRPHNKTTRRDLEALRPTFEATHHKLIPLRSSRFIGQLSGLFTVGLPALLILGVGGSIGVTDPGAGIIFVGVAALLFLILRASAALIWRRRYPIPQLKYERGQGAWVEGGPHHGARIDLSRVRRGYYTARHRFGTNYGICIEARVEGYKRVTFTCDSRHELSASGYRASQYHWRGDDPATQRYRGDTGLPLGQYILDEASWAFLCYALGLMDELEFKEHGGAPGNHGS